MLTAIIPPSIAQERGDGVRAGGRDPAPDGAVRAGRRRLPERIRARVLPACLPMEDLDENGAIVNALQRQAAIVVQKSLKEGFGLTVTEAMGKAARESVRANFLEDRHSLQYVELMGRLLAP
jgi:hypothetical protein